MTPENFATLILVILGAGLQLVFKFAPKVSEWYQNHSNKGLLALIGAVLVGVGYSALSCTPFAADLNIAVSCDKSTVFLLLRSVFIIASAQQLTYLYTKNKSG